MAKNTRSGCTDMNEVGNSDSSSAALMPVVDQTQNVAVPVNPWQETTFESYRVTNWPMPCVCFMIKKLVITFIKVAIVYLFLKDFSDWLVRISFPHSG